jgi:malate dehydrogenase (oxaloacetate-decarboxylating)
MSTISRLGGHVGAIDIVKSENHQVVRDITINTRGREHIREMLAALEEIEEVEIRHTSDRTFLMHLGGKIEVTSRFPITHRDELSMAYTPGVARVCMAIHEKPEKVHNLTIKNNTVAIVTDGSAVLGLGNIGPEASMPVMEGKAMLLKEFAGVNAFPICLNTQDADEIIETVKRIAPSFGAVNLEDISAPRCFEIENRLREECDIPVFHDDQHGTAAVLTAGLINALKIVKKKPEDLTIVINGVGAAGTACKDMLLHLGVKNIIGCDRSGIISRDRSDLNSAKQAFLQTTNPHNKQGVLSDAMVGADVFVGLSAPNALSVTDLHAMNSDPIIFPMANPTPEIMPEIAREHVAVMGTGRSDYPNQINNLLAFPGILKGTLACLATDINDEMKLAAAYAIADMIDDEALSPDYVIPSVFNQGVVTAVAEAVMKAARKSGVARK